MIRYGWRWAPASTRDVRSAAGTRAGLDESLPAQYWHFLSHAATGDLGVSFRTGQPVTTSLMHRLPATLSLAATALVIALLIAVPLGVLSAVAGRLGLGLRGDRASARSASPSPTSGWESCSS